MLPHSWSLYFLIGYGFIKWGTDPTYFIGSVRRGILSDMFHNLFWQFPRLVWDLFLSMFATSSWLVSNSCRDLCGKISWRWSYSFYLCRLRLVCPERAFESGIEGNANFQKVQISHFFSQNPFFNVFICKLFLDSGLSSIRVSPIYCHLSERGETAQRQGKSKGVSGPTCCHV